MVDIIVFGVAGNRQKIERIFADEINICGYSDIGPHFEDNSIKMYESKPFISLQELSKYKFDYIVVCIESTTGYLKCEEVLREYGVPLKKIVPTWPFTFKESVFQNTYLDYLRCDKTYEKVIFGASTSRYGLIADLLGQDCFKFSQDGMDLRGIELFISNLLNNSPHFTSTKTVIFDFLYYMFNLDNCSTKQGQNIFRRMAIYECFDDWGHYLSNEEADIRFIQYSSMKKLFSHKYEKIISSLSNNYVSCDVMKEDVSDVRANGVWTKIYADSIRENEQRFERILQMLKSIGANVYVVIFPLNATFVKNNSYIIGKHKKMFYKRMEKFKNEYNISILDFNEIDEFPDNYYYDVIHMNYCGAMKITQIVREKFLKKISNKQSQYDFDYSVKLLNWGWTHKEKSGNTCGISGDYNGISGLLIHNNENLFLSYQIHSLHCGWSELTEQGTAVEFDKEPINAIRIYNNQYSSSLKIRYKTYILGQGWSLWVEEGQVSSDEEKDIIIMALIIELFEENKVI